MASRLCCTFQNWRITRWVFDLACGFTWRILVQRCSTGAESATSEPLGPRYLADKGGVPWVWLRACAGEERGGGAEGERGAAGGVPGQGCARQCQGVQEGPAAAANLSKFLGARSRCPAAAAPPAAAAWPSCRSARLQPTTSRCSSRVWLRSRADVVEVPCRCSSCASTGSPIGLCLVGMSSAELTRLYLRSWAHVFSCLCTNEDFPNYFGRETELVRRCQR
jgi:hypothetical protein